MIKNKIAFTLVELIVVITILAILGTIAFISLQGYSTNSRNSVRITDSHLIKKALGLYIISNSKYPNPDNHTNVTYSGTILWKQGSFGESVYRKLKSLSKIPLDPLLGVTYDYSVINKGDKFVIGSIREGGLYLYNNSIVNKASAITNNDVVSIISGDYYYKDIKISTGSYCYNITAPSLIINNLGSSGSLLLNNNYKFVFNGSKNIPNSYFGSIDLNSVGRNFEISEVYNKCSIDTINDLELYINNLSQSYQQYNGISQFDDIIFNSNTSKFKLNSILKLKDDGLIVNDSIISQLKELTPYNHFLDEFTGSLDMWNGGVVNYEISLNDTLNKVDNSLGNIIFPDLNPGVTLGNFKNSFIIKNITGEIIVYSNYIDVDNTYGLILSNTGYKIFQKIGGVMTILSEISDSIGIGDKIDFNVTKNILKFYINDIEKDRIVATGKPGLNIKNTGDQIDDYNFYYK